MPISSPRSVPTSWASLRAKASAGFRMFRLGGGAARVGPVHGDRELWRDLFEL